jgi:SAM-dependent methyltransferase
MTAFPVPTDQEFLTESARFLRTCDRHCSCATGWHFIWSAYKASGRRRSIYYQQPQLSALLAPIQGRIRKVLVAGTADAGILQVLDSILGEGVDYVVFDICEAPLQEVRHHARQAGIRVRCTQVSLQEFRADETFDLVFVHNTLCFLDPESAGAVLRELRRAITPGGHMACGMRYDLVPPRWTADSAAELVQEIRAMLAHTFGPGSALGALVEPHLAAYAHSRAPGQRPAYSPDAFLAMVAQAGYRSVGAYQDQSTPSSILSTAPNQAAPRSDVYLLQPT